MKSLVIKILILLLPGIMFAGCSSRSERTEKIFASFLKKRESEIRTISVQANKVLWDVFSKNYSFDSLVVKYKYLNEELLRGIETYSGIDELTNSLYTNNDDYEFLIGIEKSGLIKDTLLTRQLKYLLRNYSLARNNHSSEIQEVVGKFFALQGEIDSVSREKKLPQSVVISQNPQKVISLKNDYIQLVRKMNQRVKDEGFSSFFEYELFIEEIDPEWFNKFLADVEKLTRADYLYFKLFADSVLTAYYGKKPCPFSYYDYLGVARSLYYRQTRNAVVQKDSLAGIFKNYFRDQGFETDDIFSRSDLWYREGKKNFSYVQNIDFETDIRIYGNFRESPVTLTELLHELGHAVHYKYISSELPYFLREPSGTLSEGVSMYLKSWLDQSPDLRIRFRIESNSLVPPHPVEDIISPVDLLIIRRLITGCEFERQFFADTGQDPDQLWAKLAEKYLFIPANSCNPLPFYFYYSYHQLAMSGFMEKYLVGYAIAAQLNHAAKTTEGFNKVLKEKVFKPGNSRHWSEIIREATGEDLNPGYISGLIRKSGRESQVMPQNKK